MTKKDIIKVECAHTRMVPIVELVAHPRNPNKHPQKQIDLLAKIIQGQGWRNPIVVSNRSGFITKGHCRLEAARILQCEDVPVDFQDYENEASEWADMIADNRIAELAEMEMPDLKDLLEDFPSDFDMDWTGFDAGAIEGLMTQFQKTSPGNFKEYDEDIETTNTCPKCGYKWSGNTGE